MGTFLSEKGKGLLLCLVISVPAWLLGMAVPVVGGPIFGILLGMVITLFIKDRTPFAKGIGFTSKYLLQTAVVLLGFGLNLNVILRTGAQSLPIICTTICTSLVVSYVVCKLAHIPGRIATLIGVGSSICGGSAIAATAPVIGAKDEEVAQSISVIFFFNLIAALVFPYLGTALGFDTTSGEAFGIFAGTAVNDTSSVTATAATWDTLYGLGAETLNKAVTVKLTRTLAIIPITLVLAVWTSAKAKREGTDGGKGFSLKRAFPMFILYFVLASVVTTVATAAGVPASAFTPLQTLSKYLIVLAMVAIGLNTNIVKLVKTGAKPIGLGFTCWVAIIAMSLASQKLLGIW